MSSADRTTETNKRIIERLYYQGFSGGNLEVVEEIFSPDIQLFDPNLPPGIEGVKAIVRKNNSCFADWQFTLHELLAVDDRVVARWTAQGRHVGSFMGEEPTGKEVQLQGIAIYQMLDGKIVADWVMPDNFGLLKQLGVIPDQLMAG